MLRLQTAPPSSPSCDWDFVTANTKLLTHGIHPYPAMMIPQIARRLVTTYGGENGVLFDPYCGTGTTLLEGMLEGMSTIGTDLNPLARLIAKVKTTPVEPRLLDQALNQLPTAPDTTALIPDIPNLNYWFAPEIQAGLATLKHHITTTTHPSLADVLKIAFSITVRKASWTRPSEFKLYRLSADNLSKHKINVFHTMRQTLSQIKDALATISDLDTTIQPPIISDFNTTLGIPDHILRPASVDLVVTSPPYGDSRTTVAYGQFSRLSSQWLGFSNASHIDNQLMGGKMISTVPNFNIISLDNTLSQIATVDKKRAREVAAFFVDYQASIRNISSIVKPSGYVCYVVGNRTVKGCLVPTAEATSAFFGATGFKLIQTFIRNIPHKRMPAVNSPSNTHGKLAPTMSTEHIIILQKQSR